MESSSSMDGLVQAEIYLSLLSSLFNLLLLYILSRYLVFHDHLRTLVFQCHLFVLVSNLFVFIRGVLFLFRSSFTDTGDSNRTSCPSASTPSFFIGLFLILSILICVERSYASFKYDTYEQWTKNNTLIKGIFALWVISLVFCRMWSISFSVSPIPCPPPRLLSTPVNDANLPIVIFGVFFLAFIPIFYSNYTRSAATLKEYVKQDYSSLSSRYQLKENTTTCRRFLVQNGVCAVLCLSMFVGNGLMTNARIHREIQYLFYPLAGIIMSLNFLIFQDSVYRKMWNMYWDGKDAISIHWANTSIRWRKEAEVPLLPT